MKCNIAQAKPRAECEAFGKNPDKCREIKDGWRCPRYERRHNDRS